ncbi:hypothetical protein [Niveispirillum sp. KHB5.9]|uniref:hypothetical protein n=1 Tax=Niveispirillum sp. KHB5.9 TaxID=3400269 RepID=UPI003A880529
MVNEAEDLLLAHINDEVFSSVIRCAINIVRETSHLEMDPPPEGYSTSFSIVSLYEGRKSRGGAKNVIGLDESIQSMKKENVNVNSIYILTDRNIIMLTFSETKKLLGVMIFDKG